MSVVSLIPTPGSCSQTIAENARHLVETPPRKGITSRRRRIGPAASAALGPAATRTRERANVDRRRSIMFCASSPEIPLSRGNAQHPSSTAHNRTQNIEAIMFCRT